MPDSIDQWEILMRESRGLRATINVLATENQTLRAERDALQAQLIAKCDVLCANCHFKHWDEPGV